MLSLLKHFLEPHLSPYTFPVPFQPRSVCCSLSSFSLGWGKSVKVLVVQLCPILCYPMDYSLQAPLSTDSLGRNTGVVTISFSRGSSQSRDRTQVSYIAGRFFTVWVTMEASCLIRGGCFSGLQTTVSNITVVYWNIQWNDLLVLI